VLVATAIFMLGYLFAPNRGMLALAIQSKKRS